MRFTDSDAKRFWAKVDKSSGQCWNWTAGTYDRDYGCFWAGGRNHRAHRVAYVLSGLKVPDDLLLDHKCFNHRCVNPSHLRPVTQKQNGEHRSGHQSNNKTKIRGVIFRPSRNKYVASVVHNGQRHWLGSFESAEQAGRVAEAARQRMFTHDDAKLVAT